MSTATPPILEDLPTSYRPDEIDRRLTRWIFFAGDVLPPSQKRTRADLRLGGEYLGQEYKTLSRTRNIVTRCFLTPMEIGYDFIPQESLGGGEGEVVRVLPSDATEADKTVGMVTRSPLAAIEIFPGDQIKLLLSNMRSNDKGIVEAEPLRGVTYADAKEAGLQSFIFPNWEKIWNGVDKLPNKISELQKHFEGRLSATADADIKSVIEACLTSCDIYREWGRSILKSASQLVATPMTNGFVHTYSDLCEMLFEQLEIQRTDLLTPESQIADVFAKVTQGQNVNNDDMKAVLLKMAENQDLLMRFLANQQGALTAPVCASLNAAGKPCGAKVVKEIDGKSYCTNHGE